MCFPCQKPIPVWHQAWPGLARRSVGRGEEGDFGHEMTSSHPWGVKPWGNFHWSEGEPKSDARSSMSFFALLEDEMLLCVLGFLDAAGATGADVSSIDRLLQSQADLA